jgi:hypothetical protein
MEQEKLLCNCCNKQVKVDDFEGVHEQEGEQEEEEQQVGLHLSDDLTLSYSGISLYMNDYEVEEEEEDDGTEEEEEEDDGTEGLDSEEYKEATERKLEYLRKKDNRTKKQKIDLDSINLYVLSQQTGSEEDNKLFAEEFKKQFPQYVIETKDHDKENNWFRIIGDKLDQLKEENEKTNKQLHKWILILRDPMPESAECAIREETYCTFVHLKQLSDEDVGDHDNEEEFTPKTYEEFFEMMEIFSSCPSAVFWRRERQSMKEFVASLMA